MTPSRRLSSVDIASLAAFRIIFGALMLMAVSRFFIHGWIREYYFVPRQFFHYWGFSWIHPWPGVGMYVHYALMGVAAAGILLGVCYRASALVFCALFTYAHFIDKTNYLNHYYLVSSLSLLMAFLPLDRAASVRTWRRPSEAWSTAPAWCLWLLRFQIGCVYFFGGVAKLKSDWLLHAQPLTIWLGANTDFPVLGPWFHSKIAAYAFSWAGAAFDLSICGWLLWRRSRPFAYAAVVAFHVITGRLFQLGMFPWIMSAAALVFFDPSWPRKILLRARLLHVGAPCPTSSTQLPRPAQALIATFVAWHVLVPFRHLLYPGNMLWTEQGFRFAWHVMLMEKNGALELTVVDKATGKRSLVELSEYLTRYQIKMTATQPDMILELAHMVADAHAQRGQSVEVHASSLVSLNGRPARPLIDPSYDLAQQRDGLASAPWILPAPTEAPEF